uniref:Uncharacterized protein n=1 Tax=Lepeophtheirus salmonis TaxID=72036 RepID=A0A0K2UPS6_LEPSM
MCVPGAVLSNHIDVHRERALQPQKNMVTENFVVDVCVYFLVGLKEVGKHVAVVGRTTPRNMT